MIFLVSISLVIKAVFLGDGILDLVPIPFTGMVSVLVSGFATDFGFAVIVCNCCVIPSVLRRTLTFNVGVGIDLMDAAT